MWCLVKDGMMHEFKRAESKKPHASRPLEGSLAMPVKERAEANGQKRGFQLVLGGLYGSESQESIEYEIVNGCDDDVEKWLNSISAASLLAAIASNGGMPQYAIEALAVSEEKVKRRERRSRAVAGKTAQSWDGCSVASSSLSTASTASAASSSCPRARSPSGPVPAKDSAVRPLSPRAVLHSSPPPHPSPPPPAASPAHIDDAASPPSPLPTSSARHFRRRAPVVRRPDLQHATASSTLPSIAGMQAAEVDGCFDV
jgi:hypothetical protein